MWAKAVIVWEMVKGVIFLYKEAKKAYNKFKESSIEKAIQNRKNKVSVKTNEIKEELNGEEISDKKLRQLYRELNNIRRGS